MNTELNISELQNLLKKSFDEINKQSELKIKLASETLMTKCEGIIRNSLALTLNKELKESRYNYKNPKAVIELRKIDLAIIDTDKKLKFNDKINKPMYELKSIIELKNMYLSEFAKLNKKNENKISEHLIKIENQKVTGGLFNDFIKTHYGVNSKNKAKKSINLLKEGSNDPKVFSIMIYTDARFKLKNTNKVTELNRLYPEIKYIDLVKLSNELDNKVIEFNQNCEFEKNNNLLISDLKDTSDNIIEKNIASAYNQLLNNKFDADYSKVIKKFLGEYSIYFGEIFQLTDEYISYDENIEIGMYAQIFECVSNKKK